MARTPRPQRHTLKSLPSNLHAGEPARLLIVEDESIIAMDLADQLVEMGYRVCATVDNGEDAIACTEKYRPDLVLMDIVIKGDLDGIETAHRITHRLHAPVVFLTSYSDAATVERAMKTAPYGYLTKPFQPKELRGSLEAALYKAKLESRLRESERWFSATLRCAADGLLATDTQGRVQFMNPSAELILGQQLAESVGKPLDEVLVLGEQPLIRWPRHGEGLTADIQFGRCLSVPSAKRRPLDVSFAPLRDEQNVVIGAVVAFRDVSERLAAESALQGSDERFRAAFDLAPAGMALVALSGRFLQGNAAMFSLLGVSERELLSLAQQDVSNPEDLSAEHQQLHQLLSGEVQTVEFEKRYRHRTRGEVWTLVSVSLLTQKDQPLCYLYQVHDMTERKKVEQQLTMLANFDALTGLANRAQLRASLERELVVSRRNKRLLAVVFLDLDRFKQVNDTLGHEAGDQVLQVVAARLRGVVRESDCIARLGGDEFVVLLPDLSEAADAWTATGKMSAALTEPIDLPGDNQASVGVSMGVSLFPTHGGDARTLLRCADAALYHAKEQGRDNTQFFRSELAQRSELRMQLEGELRAALDRGELAMFYQPVVRLSDGSPLYAEALLRWRHPSRGMLLPRDFLAIAEESGLMAPIGAYTLVQACHDAARLPRPLPISVNVSLRQLAAEGFELQLLEALRESGLAPARLSLELPAQILVQGASPLIDRAQRLRALGIGLTIDDFGLGPTELALLSRLRPSRLGLHGALTSAMTASADDLAIVRAALAVGRAFDIPVVAKWVETEAQRSLLADAQCGAAQGFLFGEPGPITGFIDLLGAPRAGG